MKKKTKRPGHQQKWIDLFYKLMMDSGVDTDHLSDDEALEAIAGMMAPYLVMNIPPEKLNNEHLLRAYVKSMMIIVKPDQDAIDPALFRGTKNTN